MPIFPKCPLPAMPICPMPIDPNCPFFQMFICPSPQCAHLSPKYPFAPKCSFVLVLSWCLFAPSVHLSLCQFFWCPFFPSAYCPHCPFAPMPIGPKVLISPNVYLSQSLTCPFVPKTPICTKVRIRSNFASVLICLKCPLALVPILPMPSCPSANRSQRAHFPKCPFVPKIPICPKVPIYCPNFALVLICSKCPLALVSIFPGAHFLQVPICITFLTQIKTVMFSAARGCYNCSACAPMHGHTSWSLKRLHVFYSSPKTII